MYKINGLNIKKNMKKSQPSFLTTLLILLLGNYTNAQELSLEWAKQMGGSELKSSLNIALDDLGNVYTVGFFRGTVDFDPGTGTLNLTSVGIGDIYIQKLDASGNLVWVKQMGGTGWCFGRAISRDLPPRSFPQKTA